MPKRRTNWAAPLAQALSNPICKATVVKEDALFLEIDNGTPGDPLQVSVSRKGPHVECLSLVQPVPVDAPISQFSALCQMSNSSGGEFVVFPGSDYRFFAGIRIVGVGHEESIVKACLLRLFERAAYWRNRMREIPLH